MSIVDKPTLKTYFDDGSRPTGARFEDLIDSLSHVSSGFDNGGNAFGSNAILGTNDNTSLELKTNNTSRITLDASGRLSIGSSSTSAKFHVVGDSTTNDVAILEGINQQTRVQFANSRAANTSNTVEYFNYLRSDTGNIPASKIITRIPTITAGSEASSIEFQTYSAGVQASRLVINGNTVEILKNSDTAVFIGNGIIGSGITTRFTLWHSALSATVNTDFGWRQVATGQTIVNAKLGQKLDLAINGTSLINLSSPAGGYGTLQFNSSYAVTSGSAAYHLLHLNPVYNQTATATGTIRGIYYNPSATSILGTHYAWESTSGHMLIANGAYQINDGGTPRNALILGSSNRLDVGTGFISTDIAGGVLNINSSTNRITARSIWPDLSSRSLGDPAAVWNKAFIGTVGVQNGAISTPSYSFINSLNSGMYWDATNAALRWSVSGVDRLVISANTFTMASQNFVIVNGSNIAIGTGSGTKIAVSPDSKMAFWGASTITQPASANQAALTNSTGGTYNTTISAIGNTSTTDQSIAINNAITSLHTLLDEMRNVLVNTGLMKGSA